MLMVWALKKKEIQQVYFGLIWFWVYWLIKICYEIMKIFMMFLNETNWDFYFEVKKIKSRFCGNSR